EWHRHRRPPGSLASQATSHRKRAATVPTQPFQRVTALRPVDGRPKSGRSCIFWPPMTMPAVFFGHGNPMNAIERNAYTKAWARIGKTIPKPKAIVAVSAHWYLPATLVTGMEKPRTIHDFGGFPRPLYQVTYPAAGQPARGRRVQSLA